MKNMKVTRVTYEALGKSYVTYTESKDPHYIIGVVKMIIETAHVSETKQVTISKSEFKDNNLSHVEAWYKGIGQRFYENTENYH